MNLQEKFWLKEDDEVFLKRRFERKNNMLECKTYIETQDISENKEIYVYGFKYIKTDKIDKFILIGCEADEY